MEKENEVSEELSIEDLNSRIKGFEEDHARFQDRIKEVASQRRDLQKNLADEKKIQARTVKDIVDHEVLNDDTSARGFVDAMLKVKTGGGSSHQLELNIDKLKATEDRCRERSKEISKQITDAKAQIRKIEEKETLKSCYQAYHAWYASVVENEKFWQLFKSMIGKCHAHKIDYRLALPNAGIEDDIFHDLIASRMRPGVYKQKLQMDLIRALSGITMVRPNPWFIESGKGNERRQGLRERIDRKRENFKQ
jgi:prefoldin subunit 5